jgi:hypothetical protein
MRARDCIRAALAILTALVAPATAVAAPSADAGKTQAQALLREGNVLLERGAAAEALSRFRDAYRLFPSPKLHYNIGQAHSLIAGHEAQAYDEMSRFLTDAPDASAELRAAAQSLCQRLRARVGLVSVLQDPADAGLIVDDVAAADRRAAQSPLVLGAGTHRLAIKKDGRVSAAASVVIAGGETTSVRLQLPPVPPPAPPALIVQPPVGPIEEKRLEPASDGHWTGRQKVGVALAALGAASLLFGVIEHARYFGKADDFRNAGCGTDNLSVGVNCRALDDQFNSAQAGWIAGYLGAAVLGGAGAYAFFVAPSSDAAGTADARATAGLHPGVTLRLEGRF